MKKILQKVSRIWAEKHPDEVAYLLDDLPKEDKLDFFKQFTPREIATVINFMNSLSAAEVLDALSSEEAARIIEEVAVKKSFLIFQQVSAETKEKLQPHLNPTVHKKLLKLGTYPPNSIGLLVNPQVITLRKEQQVRDVIRNIHKSYQAAPNTFFYLYVTDEQDHLLGIVSIRDLLIALPTEIIGNIMNKNVVTVQVTQDQGEVVTIIKKHNFIALPVLDMEGHFLGVVHQADILPMMEAEASDEIQKMFGAGEDERVFSSPWYSIRKRLPWLHVNLITAFIAALVVGLFESTIARLSMLAVLLPIVSGQSGNTGAQSLAVMIRGLTLREVGKRMVWHIIQKELIVGFVNGLIISAVTAFVVFAWMHNAWLAVAIGLAMQIGMLSGVLAGALIPILLKSLGHDPAQSSSIILTTVTDVVGFGGFLLLAELFTKLIMP